RLARFGKERSVVPYQARAFFPQSFGVLGCGHLPIFGFHNLDKPHWMDVGPSVSQVDNVRANHFHPRPRRRHRDFCAGANPEFVASREEFLDVLEYSELNFDGLSRGTTRLVGRMISHTSESPRSRRLYSLSRCSSSASSFRLNL